MWITRNEAVEMYARFCLARYGSVARKTVTEKAELLGKTGDVEGERI